MAMISDICSSRDHVDKRGKIRYPSDSIQFFPLFQLIGQGNNINRLVLFKKLRHSVEDLTVGQLVKISRFNDLKGLGQGVIVDKNGADDDCSASTFCGGSLSN